MEESDEEDDTVDDLWACGDAPPSPPAGYVYAPCPPLETEEQQRALVGRQVLVAHNTEPVGWHVGKVRFFGGGRQVEEALRDRQLSGVLHQEGYGRLAERRGGPRALQSQLWHR